MTLDEAIKNAEVIARNNWRNPDVMNEHQQLVIWLNELKKLRVAIPVYCREELGNMNFESDEDCIDYFLDYANQEKPKFFEVRMAYFYCACGAQLDYHMAEDSMAPRKDYEHMQCLNCKQEYTYDSERKGFLQVIIPTMERG